MGKRKGTSAAKKRDKREQRQKVVPPVHLAAGLQHLNLLLDGLDFQPVMTCCRTFELAMSRSTSKRSVATLKWCVTAVRTSRRTEPSAISAARCSACLNALNAAAQNA